MDQKTFRKRWAAAFLSHFILRVGTAALLGTLVLSPPGQAQESGAVPPVDPKTVVELLKRLEYLEPRVNELETILNGTMVNAIPPVPVAVPSITTVSAPESST